MIFSKFWKNLAKKKVGLGVLSSRIGGPGANHKNAITNTAQSLDASIGREANRVNQGYAAKAIASARRYCNNKIGLIAWSSSAKFAAGQGVTNGVTIAYNKRNLLPGAPTYKPW